VFCLDQQANSRDVRLQQESVAFLRHVRAPGKKSQFPKSKLQTNTKLQNPIRATRGLGLGLAICDLFEIWPLGL
jgi:hypothetical protein